MSDPANFYTGPSDFWDSYLKGRPPVPSSFFERISAYHASHGGQFGTVHDAGAGPGVHSARLAERFAKVIVTDVSESNVDLARSRLRGPQYEFQATKLEDTVGFPAGSVDMVFAAVMIHFTDVPKAMEAVAHQLRPGGTLAVGCFGTAMLQDPEAHAVWAKLYQKGVEQLVRKLGESTMDSFVLAASAYDAVALPEKYFHGALRVKLNEPLTDIPGGHIYDMFIPPAKRDEYPPLSRIGKSETVTFENDEAWSFKKDATALREVLNSYPFDHEASEIKELWKELDDVVREREMQGHWIVGLILATRK